MKSAIWLCSVLALLAVSLTIAQNAQDEKSPQSLLNLFHVGDHIGFSKNRDTSVYYLVLYSDAEIEKAKKYYSNQKENDEQLSKLQEESRVIRFKGTPEQKAELSKKLAELRRPTSAPVGKVFAIGTDYIGLEQLEVGSELYIPLARIVSVSRRRISSEAEHGN